METYITICKIDSQWGNLLYDTGSSNPVLCELSNPVLNLEGWDGEGEGKEFQEGGDICISMADSCSGLTENNKIL